jgi:hypothetical protein
MHEVLWFLLIDLTACLLIALILTALTGSKLRLTDKSEDLRKPFARRKAEFPGQ